MPRPRAVVNAVALIQTVKNYVSNLLAKMGMSRRSEAAAYVTRTEAEREGSKQAESWDDT